MLKKTLTALSAVALLGLAACCDETVEEGDTTIVEGQDPMADPVEVELPSTTMDEDRDSVSIGENGMSAEINDGNTSISADVDGDPSLEVETD